MIGCIIQARTGSTRLPGKIMMSIDQNDTVLSFGIKQVKSCKKIDELVIATTDLPEDDIIVDYMNKLNIKYFRGSSKDVLDRYYQCAKKFSFDPIVRIPSDKPLIDPLIVDQVIKKFYLDKPDYISNFIYPLKYNVGTEVEVFSFAALEKASKLAKKSSDREHIFPFFHNHKKNFKINFVSNLDDIKHLRFPLDRVEDLKLITKIFSSIKKRPVLKRDILNLYNKNPNLFSINKDIDPNEGQLVHLNT